MPLKRSSNTKLPNVGLVLILFHTQTTRVVHHYSIVSSILQTITSLACFTKTSKVRFFLVKVPIAVEVIGIVILPQVGWIYGAIARLALLTVLFECVCRLPGFFALNASEDAKRFSSFKVFPKHPVALSVWKRRIQPRTPCVARITRIVTK